MAIWKSILLIFVGWLLSTLTAAIVALWANRRTKRAAFTKLYLVLEDILVSLEFAAAWREAGGIETTAGLFDLDESHLQLIPPCPPTLPEHFDAVASAVADWESVAGKHEMTKKLQAIKHKIRLLNQIHAGLRKQAELGENGISPRAITTFETQISELKRDCTQLLRIVRALRRPWRSRFFGWLTWRRKR